MNSMERSLVMKPIIEQTLMKTRKNHYLVYRINGITIINCIKGLGKIIAILTIKYSFR